MPVVNLQGIQPGELRLDGEALADAFLGKVPYWDDPEIKALNPTVNLPHTAITIVHRSDGSGTTFNFTDYLSKVSPEWKSKVGEGTADRLAGRGRRQGQCRCRFQCAAG